MRTDEPEISFTKRLVLTALFAFVAATLHSYTADKAVTGKVSTPARVAQSVAL